MTEERPHLNPFRDRELQVGKAADRMAAGPQSVKAAKVESAASARDDAFEVLRQWTWVNSMERYRPPPLGTLAIPWGNNWPRALAMDPLRSDNTGPTSWYQEWGDNMISRHDGTRMREHHAERTDANEDPLPKWPTRSDPNWPSFWES